MMPIQPVSAHVDAAVERELLELFVAETSFAAAHRAAPDCYSWGAKACRSWSSGSPEAAAAGGLLSTEQALRMQPLCGERILPPGHRQQRRQPQRRS